MTAGARWHKQKRSPPTQPLPTREFSPQNVIPEKCEFSRTYTMTTFDVPDIKWVERFIVGISCTDRYLTQKEIDSQMESVNRALRYGRIVSIEQNFIILSFGGKDILTQYTVYHVGFRQRPPGK